MHSLARDANYNASGDYLTGGTGLDVASDLYILPSYSSVDNGYIGSLYTENLMKITPFSPCDPGEGTLV